MPRFLTGDDLGSIKAIRYSAESPQDGPVTESKILHDGKAGDSLRRVQKIAASSQISGINTIAAGFSDGFVSLFSLDEEDNFKEQSTWKETRLATDQRYIGLTVSKRGIFSCTSNGALRMVSLPGANEQAVSLASLPTRLQEWRMSPNGETFAYGGDEVDLSLWDTESAFVRPSQEVETALSKKRKRNNALLSGEIWRANNVPNDSLGLRQPIRITSLSYLPASSGTHHLITGTQFGDVRRYDTRAGRRPVSDWKVGKVGGIKTLENGLFEHQLFVSDCGTNLFSLDLRNGQILYGYKGLSGTVTSIAPSPSMMASTSLDRYTRIHSTFSPPQEQGKQQERRGEVLTKVFMNSTPTVIVWDQNEEINSNIDDDSQIDDNDVWEHMKPVEDNEEATTKTTKRSRKS